MITLDEFLKRWPGRVEKTTAEEIQLFIDTVLDRSDDYERMVAKLRASGKFKSIFPTTYMNTTNLLSARERSDYPRDFIAPSTGRRPKSNRVNRCNLGHLEKR